MYTKIASVVLIVGLLAAIGAGQNAPGREKPADVMGRIAQVSADGKVLTVQMPPKNAGEAGAREAKPDEVRINLTDKTRANYYGVAENAARERSGPRPELLRGLTRPHGGHGPLASLGERPRCAPRRGTSDVLAP